jgi:hypothetical protein
MNKYKFAINSTVRFVGDKLKYKVARRYKTESGNKYDLVSFNAKYRVDGIPEEHLENG